MAERAPARCTWPARLANAIAPHIIVSHSPHPPSASEPPLAADAQGTQARGLAAVVLVRVARDAAYAERTLAAELARTPLAAADCSFATELVYGTLRRQLYLDFQLERFMRDPVRKLPHEVAAALRLGAHQIVDLRVPAYSAVNTSVDLVPRRFGKLRGLCNAVLRRLAAAAANGQLADPYDPRHCGGDRVRALAVQGCIPEWFARRLTAQLGESGAEQWCEASWQVPPLALRINRLRGDAAGVTAELSACGAHVQTHAWVPGTLLVRGLGPVGSQAAFAAGRVTVQDPAATLVGLLAAPRAGMTVLDACAAPGGKATHMAELMGDVGSVIAVDRHPGRLRLIDDARTRLGLKAVTSMCLDATDAGQLAAALRARGTEHVDLALVDAPCSGLGTLRRRPELRESAEARIAPLCATQDRLLDAVATCVRHGGVLVYSVCTPTQEEGEARVLAFLERRPDFEPDFEPDSHADPALAPFVAQTAGDSGALAGCALRCWTHLHDADSFFAVRLRRGRADTNRRLQRVRALP